MPQVLDGLIAGLICWRRRMTESELRSMDADRRLAAWLEGLSGHSVAGRHTALRDQRQGQFIRHLILQSAEPPEFTSETVNETMLARAWLKVRAHLKAGAKAHPSGSALASAVLKVISIHRSVTLHTSNQFRYALADGVAAMVLGLTVYLYDVQRSGCEGGDKVIMSGYETPTHLVVPPRKSPQ